MTKSRNFLGCGILATMAFLYGACNSDEIPLESASDSRSSNTESDSNTNTDSNNTPGTPGTQSESDSESTPTGSDSATDSATDSAADATNTNTNTNTEGDTDTNSTPGTNTNTNGETESDSDATETAGDTEDTAGVCEQPPASDECESCLYANCKDEYCSCKGDEKCLCVMTCLDGVTGGENNKLDDLLGLDLDDLLNNLLDGVLGDLFDDLTDQDFDDLTEILECLTNDPCGVPLGIDLEDLLDGTNLDPEDLLDLDNLLDLDDLDDILENILEVTGNSLAPLLTCSELTNPDGQCGTLCPLEESALDD